MSTPGESGPPRRAPATSYPPPPPGYPVRPRSATAPRQWADPAAPPRDTGRTSPSNGRAAERRPEGTDPARVTLTGAGAVLLLVAAGSVGAAVDLLFGPALGIATTVLLPVGAVAAAWLVRRSALFWVVVAPPLVYLLLVVTTLLVAAELTVTAVAAGVVYGFPAMAIATAIAIAIGALRQVSRR